MDGNNENQFTYYMNQYNEIKDRLCGIFIKLVISFGLFAYTAFCGSTKEISLSYILEYLLYSMALYTVCTVFGACVKLTGNYFIAIVCFCVCFAAWFTIGDWLIKIVGKSNVLNIVIGGIVWVIFLSPFFIDCLRIIKMIRAKKIINSYVKSK